jgi:hypothetical protein
VGRAIELRKTQNQDADSLLIGGRQHGCFAIIASEQSVLRSSKNPRTLRNNMHENRETSEAPRAERERGRSAKAQNHTADAHAPEESDRAITGEIRF